MITIRNNFEAFKNDFKKDTGLEFNKENMPVYIQYANARFNDMTQQLMQGLTHELLNKIDFLPQQITLKVAEMIRTHDTIQKLLKK